jgi:CAAX prenyl protease-like protein
VPAQPQIAAPSTATPSARYIAPFIIFLLFLAIAPKLPIAPQWEGALRVAILAVVCWICWPREITLRPAYPLESAAIGAAVFALWIAPDLLIPGYRDNFLFSNALLGHMHSSLSPEALRDPGVLVWRTARAVLIVPVIEELFWRGWLMRWLINQDFQRVPLGAYSPFSFWITAVLFASEHGPYWDVGLLTGIIYNCWMIRSKSISSCILMHAVTNAALSAYVIAAAQWQYWQ